MSHSRSARWPAISCHFEEYLVAAAVAACTQSPPPPSHKDLCNMRGHFDSLLGTPFLPLPSRERERGAFLQLAALKMRTHSRPLALAPTSWTFVRTCPDQRARHHLREYISPPRARGVALTLVLCSEAGMNMPTNFFASF